MVQKIIYGFGGYPPPPFRDKIHKVVFDVFPNTLLIIVISINLILIFTQQQHQMAPSTSDNQCIDIHQPGILNFEEVWPVLASHQVTNAWDSPPSAHLITHNWRNFWQKQPGSLYILLGRLVKIHSG